MSDTLQQYYISGDDSSDSIWYNMDGTPDIDQGQSVAQTFTTGSAYTISKVSVKLYRDIGATGTVYIYILPMTNSTTPSLDNNPPLLAYAIVDVSTLTTDTEGEWKTLTLTDPGGASLSANTMYCIMLGLYEPGLHTDKVYWKQDTTGASYSGGQALKCNVSGYFYTGAWSVYPGTVDCMFRTYSEGYTFYPPYDIVTYKRLVAAAANTFWYETI